MGLPKRVACLSIFALLVLAPAAQAAPSACESARAVPAEAGEAAVVRATLCLLNAERSRHGLRPLKAERRLARAARRHARDMDRRNYFDHTSPSGTSFVDRIRSAGYLRGARAWALAENIAWGSHDKSTPRAILRAWMNSPGHRANILTASYRHIGIGVSNGAPVGGVGGGATYATDFGSRG